MRIDGLTSLQLQEVLIRYPTNRYIDSSTSESISTRASGAHKTAVYSVQVIFGEF